MIFVWGPGHTPQLFRQSDTFFRPNSCHLSHIITNTRQLFRQSDTVFRPNSCHLSHIIANIVSKLPLDFAVKAFVILILNCRFVTFVATKKHCTPRS